MSTEKRHWWESIWEQLPAAINELPLLSAGEQTKLTWARPIEVLAEAPPVYADSLAELSASLGYFPRSILTPSYAGFLARTTEKLVCCYDDQLHIFEKSPTELRSIVFTQTAIDFMEFGSILLKAWLKIVGTDNRGQHTNVTIKFNAVTDFLFTPILNRWRCARRNQGAATLADEQARFDYLAHDNYKFMNVARRVLLPGDRVLAHLMQPELRTPLAALFGHAYTRLKAPAHIVVLTDRELIVAAEESGRHWRDDTRYGSISTYVPLTKVAGAALHTLPDSTLQMAIQLPAEERLELDFAAAQADGVQELLQRLLETAGQRTGAT